MQEKTFVTGVRSDGYCADMPEAAQLTIDLEMAKRIVSQQKLAIDLDLFQLESFDSTASFLKNEPESNEGEEDEDNIRQTEANTLHVSQSEFWFSGFIANTNVEVFSERLPIAELVKHFGLTEDKPPAQQEVSLDGGVTWMPAKEGVRIVYRGVPIDGEDGLGEVHINATHEGLITDIWTTREEPLDHNIGTDCVLIEDLVSRLVAESA